MEKDPHAGDVCGAVQCTDLLIEVEQEHRLEAGLKPLDRAEIALLRKRG